MTKRSERERRTALRRYARICNDRTTMPRQLPLVERIRPQLPAMILEFSSVVLGVLLALSIDQCREDHARHQLSVEVNQKLDAEIRANRSRLVGVMPDQNQQLEEISNLIEAVSSGPEDGAVEGEIGLRLTAEYLADAAWQTAVVTEAIRFMDLDAVSRLSEIYALQGLVDGAFRRVLDVLTTMESEDRAPPDGGLRRLRAALAQLVELEEQLARRYDDYLATGDGD